MISIKNPVIKLAGLTLACTVLSACDPEFDNPVGNSSSYSSGTADFSNFVSLGDSLTAGYADGSLYLSGQQNSYPAILAKQFATVGGGGFTQPLVNDDRGGLLFGNSPSLDDNGENKFPKRLVLNAEPKSPPEDLDPKGPEEIAGTSTTEVFNSPLIGSTFNNMGVPGAKSFHLVTPNYGDSAGLLTDPATANPYFARFASSTTTTMLTDAAAQSPTFFVLWIGNNDVLSYATTGGSGEDHNDSPDADDFNPATYGSNDITNTTTFDSTVYPILIGALTTGANINAKGVLINIPDVSTIPFFTTVPYNAVPLDSDKAEALNTAYAAYNGGLTQMQQLNAIDADEVTKRTISFAAGQNSVVILDEDLTDLTGFNSALVNMRQATAEDLLILTTSSKIGELVNPTDDPLAPTSPRWGVSAPMEDSDVLIPSEIAAINTARIAFNASIKAAADANDNLLFVDASALMTSIQSGFSYGTGSINSVYATGGGFSLDGVHPTARGYAVVANTIIDAINTGFSANIPKVDPASYSTISIK